MQGIIQFGNSVLDDVLSFRNGSLQQRKLLVQKLLFQLFLLTCLHTQAYGLIHGYNVINDLWSYISVFEETAVGSAKLGPTADLVFQLALQLSKLPGVFFSLLLK